MYGNFELMNTFGRRQSDRCKSPSRHVGARCMDVALVASQRPRAFIGAILDSASEAWTARPPAAIPFSSVATRRPDMLRSK